MPSPKVLATVIENPVLVVGGKTFICKTGKLPFGTMLKYAETDMDLLAIRRLLTKVLSDDDLDALWDVFDDVGVSEASDAIAKMVSDFSERPTRKS